MTQESFRAAGYAWRLHCGRSVIEQSLKDAVDRAAAKRAFVVCSPSVNRRTDTVRRIEAALGNRYAGVFDGIEKDFYVRFGMRCNPGCPSILGRPADSRRRRQCHRGDPCRSDFPCRVW